MADLAAQDYNQPIIIHDGVKISPVKVKVSCYTCGKIEYVYMSKARRYKNCSKTCRMANSAAERAASADHSQPSKSETRRSIMLHKKALAMEMIFGLGIDNITAVALEVGLSANTVQSAMSYYLSRPTEDMILESKA